MSNREWHYQNRDEVKKFSSTLWFNFVGVLRLSAGETTLNLLANQASIRPGL
jgi:hypothetical protein